VRSTRTSFSIGQPLAQDFRVGHLELERRRIVGEAREVGSDGLQRADEDLKELDLRGRAVSDHEQTSAGLRHPDHLAERARLVGHQHDPELRAGNVEAVVGEIEAVTVHHAPFGIA
jgi:hypothetical protein